MRNRNFNYVSIVTELGANNGYRVKEKIATMVKSEGFSLTKELHKLAGLSIGI